MSARKRPTQLLGLIVLPLLAVTCKAEAVDCTHVPGVVRRDVPYAPETTLRVIDFWGLGSHALVFKRFYNSSTSLDANLGPHWSHNFAGHSVESGSQADGEVFVLTRDSSGRPSRVSDAEGNALDFKYDAQSRISALDFGDGLITYEYDPASGMLAGVSSPEGAQWLYLYEDRRWPGALTGILDDTAARVATFIYDEVGNVVSRDCSVLR